MKEISDREDLLIRFLLDDATERERAEVEDRLLTDEESYEQMLVVEGDLMDAYVRGALPARECARFEEVFSSTARQRERVEFARGLVESATLLHEQESAGPHSALGSADSSRRKGFLASLLSPLLMRPALSYALAAAAVAVVALAVWVAVERMRGRALAPIGPQQARTEGVAPQQPEQRPQNGGAVTSKRSEEGAPPSQNETPGGPRAPEREPTPAGPETGAQPVFASITLAPGSLRDGAAAGSLVIPRGATHVRLRLEIEVDDYQSYRATISTPEGRRVWAGAARKDRQRDAQSVTVTLPAASLKRGDYVIDLTGAAAAGRFERAAQYSFRVTRED